MKTEFKLMAAPMQGLTEPEWRRAHARVCGPSTIEYFTPFIRIERGEVRTRDMRDFTSPLNEGLSVTPQVIFRDAEEWKLLVDALRREGATRIDMNMGCPFIPQVRRGRGAGFLASPDQLALIARLMTDMPDVEFSVKMRLGINDPSEALAVADTLNAMPLRHITIHPRTASQQYRGQLHFDALARLRQRLTHPLIFNGDITTPLQIDALAADGWHGVMAGRGLLTRPTLFREWLETTELSDSLLSDTYLETLHQTEIHYAQRLCGLRQLRDKMKPFWEYAPATLDKKLVKRHLKGLQ